MFAVDHWNVVPDIILMAKALGGGVMPLGAFTATPKVWECYGPNPILHTSTFGGNPLACSAALATIRVLREERYPERAARMGEYFIGKLREQQAVYPDIVADARGLGLMIGMELREEKFGGALIYEMARGGVIAVYTLNMPKVIRFEPPVIIDESHIDRACGVLGDALGKTRKMFFK
jgi:putrescine aminotransferase